MSEKKGKEKMKLSWDKVWVNIKRAWIIFDAIMRVIWHGLGELFYILGCAIDIFEIFISYGSKRRRR